ncbi:3-deoxy-D-manno-octulosonate cytidylyltransferase [bacterium F11]|nr:3-deoxy-D-manno-octulosonate cytidylyltransferase [bacterium F11]
MSSSSVLGVIPARYGSTRFPGKPLAPLLGRPMIAWVFQQAKKVLRHVVVATDDKRIQRAVQQFGGVAIMTPRSCQSGTDRMYHVSKKMKARYYANIQGDEPLLHPRTIEKTVALALKRKKISTAATHLTSRDLMDPHVVKVVTNQDGEALYFSRTTPVTRSKGAIPPGLYKHLGIYVYPKEDLGKFVRYPIAPLEKSERLEQMRALHYGLPICVALTKFDSVGVDTPKDLRQTEKWLKRKLKK